jgi:hypothetical protein
MDKAADQVVETDSSAVINKNYRENHDAAPAKIRKAKIYRFKWTASRVHENPPNSRHR